MARYHDDTYGLVEGVRRLHEAAVEEAKRARRTPCSNALRELDEEPELLALTHFPEQTGLCNVPTPGVPACTEPVHNVLFWNMVQVLQQVCNELNARGTAQRPLTTSAVLDSLQCPHATPQHARSSPVMECLVEVLDAGADSGQCPAQN